MTRSLEESYAAGEVRRNRFTPKRIAAGGALARERDAAWARIATKLKAEKQTPRDRPLDEPRWPFTKAGKFKPGAEKRAAGFSLVETVLVVAVIGILATIAVQRLLGTLERAQFAATEANMVILQKALETHKIDHGEYPESTEGLLPGDWAPFTYRRVDDGQAPPFAAARGADSAPAVPGLPDGATELPGGVTPTGYVAVALVLLRTLDGTKTHVSITGGGGPIYRMPQGGVGGLNPNLVGGQGGPSGGIPDPCPACPGGGR